MKAKAQQRRRTHPKESYLLVAFDEYGGSVAKQTHELTENEFWILRQGLSGLSERSCSRAHEKVPVIPAVSHTGGILIFEGIA